MDEVIKKALEDLGSQFQEFKTANDARIAQIQSKGSADPLLEAKVTNLNDALTKSQEKIAALETALNRSQNGGNEVAEAKNKENKQYQDAFVKYVRKGENALNAEELKTLSVGSDPDGGYTVRHELNMAILKAVVETTPMRGLASVQTISTNQYEQLKRTSRGQTGGWTHETGPRTQTTTPQLGKILIPAHEVFAEPHATQMLIDDSAVNIEQWLAEEIADEYSYYENSAFVNGNGAGKPRGILSYAAGTSDGQIQQVNSGDANVLTADGLINLQTALKEAYQVNATWLMNRATVGKVRLLKNAVDGSYLWQPGLQLGTPNMLLGRPVVMGADMPDVAANSLSVAYGDFKRGYKIVDRLGIRVLRDPFTAKPYIKFYSTKRVGGDVVMFEAIKIGKTAA